MRLIFWVLGLFALAVAIALALRLNSGYVLVVWPPYRIELSLNLMLFILAATFVAFYLVLRFIFAALKLPTRVREFRARKAVENARATLLNAMAAFFEGRFGRAEQLAAPAMETGEFPALGAVLAARAAHELRHYEQRDGYLARAQRLAPDHPAMRIIAAADMLLDERRFQDALVALKALPQKHTTALRLELRAQQQAKNWEQMLPLIDQLERRKVFDEEQALQLRRHVHAEILKRKALDQRELDECWQKLPVQLKRDPKIAAAAAQCFIALGGCVQAQQIIEQALDQQWDSELVGWYAECESSHTVHQIERAEKWLERQPHDALLLLVLGKLCARQQLWGKAQSYLEASISIESTYSAHLALAQLHDTLERGEVANRHFRASLELAVRQLKLATGGRRRTLL